MSVDKSNDSVVGSYLSIILPSLSIRNFVKFHFIEFPLSYSGKFVSSMSLSFLSLGFLRSKPLKVVFDVK